ncbi:lysophospholipid acyltransferase family protein [Polaromonas naphthalenivorans]|uniref:Lipid A biosynthesis acyltransferase n=1 Tax=Polaromonas naphthalenivorans (strain CJ2) TaxID=365044 RepID=A1VK02_POLNA|nr:lysophospholipid acyltransferase family protein [Polaromonas naphthalenivorans]ABM35980.1 lipid A biosynthesis acyltransferase [Polaromonas naphthalenivorans CJ2]
MLWLFRFFSHWPLAVLHALGAGLGWLVWLASARYRAHFRANVAQAGLPFEAARPAIAEAGRFVGELPRLWMRPRSQSCLENVRVQGQAHAEQAFAQGKGVIFFGPHCGSFELGPQALAELYGPLTAIYRPARKAWLARLESFARDRQNLTVVPASLSGIRLMHQALKANQAVAMLTDQVPPEGLGIWAPFFGRPAYTMTLAARLALQSGAALLPVSCERLPRGRGYFLKIWPAVEGLQTREKADMLQAVTRINQAIEAIVLSQPGQYLWGYARYKTPRKEAA